MSMFSTQSANGRPARDGLLERVKIDDQQIDRRDAVGLHGRAVIGIVAPRQQAPVHLRVQRLEPSIHHLGKAGQARPRRGPEDRPPPARRASRRSKPVRCRADAGRSRNRSVPSCRKPKAGRAGRVAGRSSWDARSRLARRAAHSMEISGGPGAEVIRPRRSAAGRLRYAAFMPKAQDASGTSLSMWRPDTGLDDDLAGAAGAVRRPRTGCSLRASAAAWSASKSQRSSLGSVSMHGGAALHGLVPHGRVEMEAEGEKTGRPSQLGCAGIEAVLAPQAAAVSVEAEPANVHEAETAEIAVVRGLERLGPASSLRAEGDVPRAVDEAVAEPAPQAGRGEPARRDVLDDQGRMGRRGPRGLVGGASAGSAGRPQLTIDASGCRPRARTTACRHASARRTRRRRGRPGVADDERAVGLQALVAGMRRIGQRARPHIVVGQDRREASGSVTPMPLNRASVPSPCRNSPDHGDDAVDGMEEGRRHGRAHAPHRPGGAAEGRAEARRASAGLRLTWPPSANTCPSSSSASSREPCCAPPPARRRKGPLRRARWRPAAGRPRHRPRSPRPGARRRPAGRCCA